MPQIALPIGEGRKESWSKKSIYIQLINKKKKLFCTSMSNTSIEVVGCPSLISGMIKLPEEAKLGGYYVLLKDI